MRARSQSGHAPVLARLLPRHRRQRAHGSRLSPLTAGGAAAARQACLGVTAVCAASFLPTTAPSLLFALLAAFAAAQLAFAALLAAPLGNAKVAGVLAPAAHFVCLLPRYLFFRTGEAQVVPCLLPYPCPVRNHCVAATGS